VYVCIKVSAEREAGLPSIRALPRSLSMSY